MNVVAASLALTGLLACHRAVRVAAPTSKPCNIAYQNLNQLDYGPLLLTTVAGTVEDLAGLPVPKACIGLFSADGGALVAAGETDEQGRVSLPQVQPGRYRLVATYNGLCPANALVNISSGSRAAIRAILRPRSLDACSHIELARRK